MTVPFVGVQFIIYYGLILCDIQASDLWMEFNQASGDQSVWNHNGQTHYDITMGNNVARDVHCEITMGNDVVKDIHCDVTMSNDVVICTYHNV